MKNYGNSETFSSKSVGKNQSSGPGRALGRRVPPRRAPARVAGGEGGGSALGSVPRCLRAARASLPLILQLLGSMPRGSLRERAAVLARLRAFPAQAGQIRALLEEGLRREGLWELLA